MASWFRSWHGAPTDNKWLVIARKSNTSPGIVSAVYWALLDCASQAEQRGNISHFDIETYAAFSGFEEAAISSILDAFRDKGVIEKDLLTAWETRQPQREDVSTERVRKYRDKQNETQCNATKRGVTRGNNTEKNRTETDQKRSDLNADTRTLSNVAASSDSAISAFSIQGTSEQEQKAALWKRITAIEPTDPWRKWWKKTLALIWGCDAALSEFRDVLKHVEDSMDERTRRAKGNGEAKQPERLLVKMTTDRVCKQYNITWPEHPARVNT